MINYYLITKPKIILGNLVTVGAGFLLASRGTINIFLFLFTLLGIAFIMGSACIFNNYIDRQLDKKMKRTQDRVLVLGLIPERNALAFGTILGMIGALILFVFTNLLTVFVAAVGFFVYVFLYSLWKSRTIYGTAIGSIAGAVPPVVGYCAVSNEFDMGALIFFLMMILWQMPHFFSIAVYHFDDYSAAKIPVLPIEKGTYRTKIHMVLYIVGFILAAMMLTVYDYTGYFYLLVATSLSFLWLGLCIQGFKIENEKKWGQNMFYLSLVIITAISFVIPLDIV